MKGSLFTEKHAEEWKKSMMNDFDGMKNEIKDDLKKLAEENSEEMKNQIQEDLNGMKGEVGGLKKMVEENLEKIKNDFECQKKEMMTHFELQAREMENVCEKFEDMKNQMKEDLKKSKEEAWKGMIIPMMTLLKDRLHGITYTKICFSSLISKIKHECILLKTGNEDLKTKLKGDFQKLSKELHDRDQLTKEIELLKKENAKLKKNKPQEFNEERYSITH